MIGLHAASFPHTSLMQVISDRPLHFICGQDKFLLPAVFLAAGTYPVDSVDCQRVGANKISETVDKKYQKLWMVLTFP